jgi:hypothetical protein
MRSSFLAGALIALGASAFASDQAFGLTVPVPLTITGNQATGTVGLPGINLELTITFENVVGLTSDSIEASATLVSPLNFGLLRRLPRLLRLPLDLPVLVHVGPTPGSVLTFSGAYTISFHTHLLSLDPLRPLSLLKSPDGGDFVDITKSEGIGSYRDDGSGGDFSDFLIALDLRTIDAVIVEKFDSLQALLNDNLASIPPEVAAELQAELTQARTLYAVGSTTEASDQVRAFSDFVKAHSGEEIPDVWQAASPTVINVAGRLRSAADTLKFSLDRKASH